MEQFITHFTYLGVVLVLLASGFGLPLPEDLPLLIAGYLCAIGTAELWLMIPITFLAVIGADIILFFVGRKFGQHATKLPLLRRFLDQRHLDKAERAFIKHGGKTLFVARFLPGVRSAVFFTAGACRTPVWKMVVFDGSAALISVPTIVTLGYLFAAEFDRIHEQIKDWEAIIVGTIVVGIVVMVIYQRLRRSIVAVEPVAVVGPEEEKTISEEARSRRAG
ncbi:MAG: DedA family protein [Phycisphaeraceae bacterium]|nr:DedA family protein [Phycisphaeraceae bacterium]